MTNTEARAVLNVKSLLNQAVNRLDHTIIKMDNAFQWPLQSDLLTLANDIEKLLEDYSHRFDEASERRKKRAKR